MLWLRQPQIGPEPVLGYWKVLQGSVYLKQTHRDGGGFYLLGISSILVQPSFDVVKRQEKSQTGEKLKSQKTHFFFTFWLDGL